MTDGLKGLISGDALEAEYRRRREDHDEIEVTASTTELLNKKIATEEEEGWSIKKKLKRRAILKKDKSSDRWVEDQLWSLLKNLGFHELNRDRQFMITESAGTKRQVDIFAKDDETVFIVECTHQKQPGRRTVKNVIDKINSYRQDVINAVHGHYGKEPKLKVKFAICTSDITWSKEDTNRAATAKIAVITETDLDYYEGLLKILEIGARFQFLGRYLKNEGVEGLRIQLPATRGKAGGRTFYNFLISPHDLLRIGYINHRVNKSNDDLDTYQRMVKPSRLREIGRFLDEGGKFPTNIIINFKADDGLQFQPHDKFGDTSTGMLTLPGQYGIAWIIDGQHRLYGYAHSKRGEKDDHSVVSVLAFDNLPIKEEIEMFVDINTKQVKIRRGLVDEIIAGLDIADPDPVKRLEALYANLALRLDKSPSSPLHKRICITGREKSPFCCITTVSISDQAEKAGLLGRASRGSKARTATFELGPLSDVSGEGRAALDKATKTLSLYLDLFSKRLEAHWKLGDAKGGYLCTNNGLRPLILLLSRIMDFVQAQDHVKTINMSADEIVDRVKPYVDPLITYFAEADAYRIASFRGRGSSLAKVDDDCFRMMSIINEANPNFTSKELEDHKNRRDTLGTQQAKVMIDEINTIIFDDVVATLRDIYGERERDWWMQGIPTVVKTRCDNQYNKTDGTSERWRQLSLTDYPEIVLWPKNWEVFKDYYNFSGRGKRSDAVSWIVRLNKAKSVVDHAERGPLSRDEVDFVKRIHSLANTHIKGEEKVDGRTSYLTQAPEEEPALADVA